jgi:glutathione S-transferase
MEFGRYAGSSRLDYSGGSLNDEGLTLALYHYGPSPFSARVRLALEEKGLAWESRIIHLSTFEHVEPWFLRINPKGLLPALQDGERTVYESLDILHYLEERYPNPSLLPQTGPERSEAERWIARAQAVPLEPLHAALANPAMVRSEQRVVPKVLRRIEQRAAENPDLAALYLAKREAFQARGAVYENTWSRDKALDTLDRELDALETTLTNRTWVAGERYSLADIVWTIALARFCLIGQRARLAPKARPNLGRYFAALRARPSYKSADVWDRITPGRALPLALRAFLGGPRRTMPW